MDAQSWQVVRTLFDELVELHPDQQAERLAAIGATDPGLRDSVAALLTADSQADEQLGEMDAALLSPPPTSPISALPQDPFGLSGRTVAHFRVIEPLGLGGMGVVYRAEDLRLSRTVALKVPLPGYRLDASTKRRFLHEARSAAALDHPNLCSIYEVGESEEGHPFLAMPLYAGETLKERLARAGQLPVEEAVEFARQIAEGLAAAHGAGIVHRDIKPGNVMLLPGGAVKVLDFGLAKVRDLTLTGSWAQLGTVAYMAPEQIRRESIDERTDLWALGVVLYEMLTGRRPFAGEHDISVAHAIVHEEPLRPSELRGEIPPPLEGLLCSLLRKDPAIRPASAQEVAAELAAIQSRRALPVRRVLGQRWAAATGSRRSPVYAGATVLLVLALALWTGTRYFTSGFPAGGASTDQSIAVLPFVNSDGDPMNEHFSDGLTDELIGVLGKIEGLRVTARTSTFALKGSGLSLNAIADTLGVATVLEGSVRRDGDRLKVAAQLVNAANGAVLWADVYNREVADVFEVQEEIARAIAVALTAELPRREGHQLVRRPTADLEAYDIYLQGRHGWTLPTRERLDRAAILYRRAAERDPAFAMAYAGLAETYVNLSNFGYLPATQALARARVAAEHALKLDPGLAEAHVSYGFVLASELDFERAEAAFQRAIALNPNYPWGHHYYSLLLVMLGRTDAAIIHNRKALSLDPLSLPARATRGILAAWTGDHADAERELRRALALAPDYALTLQALGSLKAANSAFEEALPLLEAAAAGAPDFPGVRGALAFVYARTGRHVEADSLLGVIESAASAGGRMRANHAFAHAVFGRLDEAFYHLEQLKWDIPTLTMLRTHPLLSEFRSDPRYSRLLRTIGVTDALMPGSREKAVLPRLSVFSPCCSRPFPISATPQKTSSRRVIA